MYSLDVATIPAKQVKIPPGRKARRFERTAAPQVGLIEVFRERAGRKERIGSAMLLDISRGGLGIRMDGRVWNGEILYLENRFVRYLARVCHCTPMESGYKVGLEFPRE